MAVLLSRYHFYAFSSSTISNILLPITILLLSSKLPFVLLWLPIFIIFCFNYIPPHRLISTPSLLLCYLSSITYFVFSLLFKYYLPPLLIGKFYIPIYISSLLGALFVFFISYYFRRFFSLIWPLFFAYPLVIADFTSGPLRYIITLIRESSHPSDSSSINFFTWLSSYFSYASFTPILLVFITFVFLSYPIISASRYRKNKVPLSVSLLLFFSIPFLFYVFFLDRIWIFYLYPFTIITLIGYCLVTEFSTYRTNLSFVFMFPLLLYCVLQYPLLSIGVRSFMKYTLL